MAPIRLKKRLATAQDDEDLPDADSRRVRVSRSPDSSSSFDEDIDISTSNQADQDIATLARKLVRYALSCDFSRTPIRRLDINTKVLMGQRAPFKKVFDSAQFMLKDVWGMELQELPMKEKVTLAQKRAAHKTTAQSKTTNSWLLVSVLPEQYRLPEILPPARNPSSLQEASYIGLYTMIIALIYAAQDRLVESRLERYLSRLFIDKSTPCGSTVEVLKRMEKESYIVRTRDSSSGEEVVEYMVGPRGRLEVNKGAVEKLMRAMYGEDAPADFEHRLARTLGTSTLGQGRSGIEAGTTQASSRNGTNDRTRVPNGMADEDSE